MKPNKSLAIATLGIATLALFPSCQDEDFGYTAQQIKNSAYAKNFTQMYGDIDPDQPWDLTSDNLARLGLFGGPSMGSGVTRAGSGPIGTAGDADAIRTFTNVKYEVEEQTLAWLNTNLTEEHDHRSLGTSFNLVGPNNDFLIIPIYQGNAGLKWDLHLVAGNGDGTAAGSTDYNIWSKSQNIFYKEDHTKDPYGEEFYYFAKDRDTSNPDGDFIGGTGKQDPEGIYLNKAFPGILEQTQASITFVLPSNMDNLTVEGYFADKDNLDTKLSVNIEGEDKQDITLNEGTTTTIDLSSLLNYDNLNNLQDLVFKINPKGDDNINGKNNYKNAFMHYTEAANRIHIYTNYDYTVEESSLTEQTNYSTGHTINRTGVKSQAMRISHDKIPGEFIMYLEITYDDGGNYAVEGEKKMSNASPHMMLALTECSINQQKVNDFAKQLVPELGEDCQYMILGCEDTNIINKTPSWGGDPISSDWDYNDIVFLVVGMPVAPQIKQIYKKRYMIEDLGSTFDFDFNDIVVDVTMEKYVNADGSVDENKTKTYAAIKHLCGTIPFQLKIGNTEFGKVTDPTNHEQSIAELRRLTRANGVNWNPDEEDISKDLAHVAITGWDPQQNNISIRVWPQDKTSNGANATPDNESDNFSEFTDIPTTDKYGAQGFTFPSNGDFPYIIAVDQTINWMPELKSIPKDWFKTWTSSANQKYEDYNNGQGGGNGGNTGGETGGSLNLSQINSKNFELKISDLISAGATDNSIITIYVSSPAGRKDWGVGKVFGNDGNEKYELKGANTSTDTYNTYDLKFAQLKDWAGGTNGKVNIQVWDDYMVTKIEISEPQPANNEIQLETTYSYAISDNNYCTVPASQFSTFKSGEEVVIYVNQQGTISLESNGESLGTPNYDNNNKVYNLSVTDDVVSKLKENGLTIKGSGFTLTRVRHKVVGYMSEWGEDNNFAMTSDAWLNYFRIENGVNDLHEGDVITINVSKVASGSSTKVYKMSNASGNWEWSEISDATINLSGGTIKFTVTDAMLTNLQGFAVQGQGFTINSVTKSEATGGDETGGDETGGDETSNAIEVYSGSMTINANSNYNQIQSLDDTSNGKLIEALNKGKKTLKFYINKNVNINVVCKDWGKIAEGIEPVENNGQYIATLELTDQNISDIKNKEGIAMQQVPTEYTLTRITIE